jgi:hypothetical protein
MDRDLKFGPLYGRYTESNNGPDPETRSDYDDTSERCTIIEIATE